jgi:hypothetical protein
LLGPLGTQLADAYPVQKLRIKLLVKISLHGWNETKCVKHLGGMFTKKGRKATTEEVLKPVVDALRKEKERRGY